MLTELDFTILNWIQAHMRCAFLDVLMPLITLLGSGGVLWLAIAAVLAFRKRTRTVSLTIVIALLLSLILGNGILKHLFERSRPFATDGALLTLDALLLAPPIDRFSFPSGHALSSFASAFVLLHFFPRGGIAAVAVAACIAFSRLYLYFHFPSDVVGAILLAAGIAILSVKLSERLLRANRADS